MKHTKWSYYYPDYNNPDYIAIESDEREADICHIHYGKGIRDFTEAKEIAKLITNSVNAYESINPKAVSDLLEACKYTIEQIKNIKGKAFPILPILNAIQKAEEV